MRGTKKSASFTFPTLARWQTSKSLPFNDTIEIPTNGVKPHFRTEIVQLISCASPVRYLYCALFLKETLIYATSKRY
jgi:hypothetical protein